MIYPQQIHDRPEIQAHDCPTQKFKCLPLYLLSANSGGEKQALAGTASLQERHF